MGNPGVHKPVPAARMQLLLIVQILEAQHSALMLIAQGCDVAIDALNDDCRSLLSQLVELKNVS